MGMGNTGTDCAAPSPPRGSVLGCPSSAMSSHCCRRWEGAELQEGAVQPLQYLSWTQRLSQNHKDWRRPLGSPIQPNPSHRAHVPKCCIPMFFNTPMDGPICPQLPLPPQSLTPFLSPHSATSHPNTHSPSPPSGTAVPSVTSCSTTALDTLWASTALLHTSQLSAHRAVL